MMKNSILLFLIFVTANLCVAQTARKTVTNTELEKYRQERVRSEAEYRANYKKLGMPSPEELEQQRIEGRRQAEEDLRQLVIRNAQDADDLQAQAGQLKAEIINIQAQIDYLNRLIANLPGNSVFRSPSEVFAVGVISAPYGFNRPFRGGFRQQANVFQGPNVQTAINAAAAAPNPYYGTPLQRVGVRARIGGAVNPIVRIGGGRRHHRGPYFYDGYPVPYAVNNNSYQREELISRLRFLEQTKAGMYAQLESLREEARRAGVRID